MSLRTQGFLSGDIEQFRVSVRKCPTYKPWFDFADDLIHLGLDMLVPHEVEQGDRRGLVLSVLLVRSHQSLQAAVILVEKGMIADARIVVRSAVESAIACVALGADETFVDRLIEAHHKNRGSVARELLGDPDYSERYSQHEVGKLQAVVDEVAALKISSGRDLRSIIWADAAKQHCKDLYICLYRLFSNDGTHTTFDTMDRYVESDATGRIQALKLGPDHVDSDEVLNAACLTFLWAAGPFARIFQQKEFEEKIGQRLQRYRELAA
jgi:hypothetical protein